MRISEFLNNIFLIEFTEKISLGYQQGEFGEQANIYKQLFLPEKRSEKLNSFYLKIKSFSSRLYKLSIHDEMNNSDEISTTNPDMLLICWDNNHSDLFTQEQELIRNMYNIVFPSLIITLIYFSFLPLSFATLMCTHFVCCLNIEYLCFSYFCYSNRSS